MHLNKAITHYMKWLFFFEILESFEQQCLERYKIKYDLSTLCGDYLIQFSPLRVFEYKNLENGRNVE